MRFLANENFPDPSILLLRDAGHDVRSIRTDHPGISDQQVIAFAQAEDRIIITFDKDYGRTDLQRRDRITTCRALPALPRT